MPEVRPATTNRIRVFNPTSSKRKKPWTLKQGAARKDQPERFMRDVLEDDDRAMQVGLRLAKNHY